MTPGSKGLVAVAALNFPLWIVTQRRGLISKPVEPDGSRASSPPSVPPNTPPPLWSAEARRSGKTGKPENRLVARPTLRDLMADLRLQGMQGLCLDPTKDGAGTQVAFDDL